MLRITLLFLSVVALPAATRLTLREAEQMALRGHPQLEVSRNAELAAKELPIEVGARRQPQLQALSSGALAEDNNTRLLAGGINNPVIYNRLGIGVSLTQLITDFGRTKHLVESARRRADAAAEALVATRADVLLRVGQAYFAALRAQSILHIARETLKTRQLVADRAAALAANQLKSELDVSFARVDLQEGRLLENNASNAVQAAMVDLSAAVGLSAPAEFELVEEALPQPLPPDWDDVARQALENRPELKQARLEAQAAAAFVRAERALLYPTVNLAASSGVAPFHVDRLQGHWNAAGITLDLPFLNGGLYQARRREAEARERAARSFTQVVANQVAHDVRVAYLNASNAFERWRLSATFADLASRSFALAQGRYDLGLSSIVELSQAQLSLTRANIARSGALFDYQAARVALDYQQGKL